MFEVVGKIMEEVADARVVAVTQNYLALEVFLVMS